MIRQQFFPRDQILPSWFVNSVQDRIEGLTNLRLHRVSTTVIEVPGGPDDDSVVVNVDGNWRFVEAATQAAHPGGAAGVYLVFVTAAAQDIDTSPEPNTDNTDYSFGLTIVPTGDTPDLLAGVVDVYRRVGSLTWDGTSIATLVQEVGSVAPAQLEAGALVSSTVVATRQPGGGFLLEVQPLGVTNAHVATGAAIAESKLALASDAAAGTPSRRTLGMGATQAAAGNDVRFPAGADIVPGDVAAANKDGLAAVLSLRTLGTSATQAAAGNQAMRVIGTKFVQAGSTYTRILVKDSVTGDENEFIVGPLESD